MISLANAAYSAGSPFFRCISAAGEASTRVPPLLASEQESALESVSFLSSSSTDGRPVVIRASLS